MAWLSALIRKPLALAIAALVAVIAVLLFNTYANIRIPIPLLPDIRIEGWKPRAKRLQVVIDRFDKAQDEARKLAAAQMKAKEAEYRQKAEEADHEHEIALDGALTAADSYIDSHRVCQADRGSAGGTPAAAEGDNSGVPAGVSGDTLVSVTDADVRACASAATYAVKAHDWAIALSAGE